MSLLGNEVVGPDILPSMIDGMTECLEEQEKRGVHFSVKPVCGEICNADLESRSFDAIYSLEAIEHVHDIPLMLDECARLLKQGGVVMLVNDQNSLNEKGLEETRVMWKKRESSWEWARQLETWRPVEHKDAKPFAVMREEIIRAANPRLSDAAVETIVNNTAGLLKQENEAISKQYVAGMGFKNVPEFDRCRNPLTGEFAERLFDPFALAELMRAAGFRTTVRHFFRKFPLNLMNGIQFKPFNKALFILRSPFIIMGVKAYH
jgi:SAM-dependent methyltransferase